MEVTAGWRRLRRLAAVVALAGSPAAAQGVPTLPVYEPLNPLVEARSGLVAQPFVAPGAAGRVHLALDYASLIEAGWSPGSRFLFDAEVARLRVEAMRPLGADAFIAVRGGVHAAFAGVFDGAIDAYHRLLGVHMATRESRPRNEFAYTMAIGPSLLVEEAPYGPTLDDVRITIGRRHTRWLQGTLALTLPTSGAPRAVRRGIATVSAVHTARIALPIGALEATAGVGWAPRAGPLAGHQRELLASGSASVLWRIAAGHHLWGTIFHHAPLYREVGMRSLERGETSLDVGWEFPGPDAQRWRIGITEDILGADQAVDVAVRLGVVW